MLEITVAIVLGCVAFVAAGLILSFIIGLIEDISAGARAWKKHAESSALDHWSDGDLDAAYSAGSSPIRSR